MLDYLCRECETLKSSLTILNPLLPEHQAKILIAQGKISAYESLGKEKVQEQILDFSKREQI
jgi:hypothetical protein